MQMISLYKWTKTAPMLNVCKSIVTFCFVLAAPFWLFSQRAANTFDDLELALATPDSVEVLVLKRQRIATWPDELCRFPNLKVLDLSHNRITELPDDLTCLAGLEKLVLTGNRIDTLPASIGQLKSLRYLGAGNNEIFHIAEEIGDLAQLVQLDLWSNNLYYLPNSVMNLSALKEIDLRGIQMGEHYQAAIKAIVPEGVNLRISMHCNCD
jgi:Leucine-rich repeat (LRR) protein